jgi:hypothetical protein
VEEGEAAKDKDPIVSDKISVSMSKTLPPSHPNINTTGAR